MSVRSRLRLAVAQLRHASETWHGGNLSAAQVVGLTRMRICRFKYVDESISRDHRLGLLDDGGVRDVTGATELLPTLRWPLTPGDQLIAHLDLLRPRMQTLASTAPVTPRERIRLLSPVANPAKFVCGAGNWQHHGAPFGMLGFMGKAATSVAGEAEGVQISWPDRVTVHEPELAIIIGKQCRNVTEADALSYVAGYSCALDTTLKPEREDWAFCKSFDTYGTLGPCLVTADEIPEPAALSYRFWVNEELRGERKFADLTGSPRQMIAFASSAMTLYPGDVILSGAADVGPINVGDTLTLEIQGIGRLVVPVERSVHARA